MVVVHNDYRSLFMAGRAGLDKTHGFFKAICRNQVDRKLYHDRRERELKDLKEKLNVEREEKKMDSNSHSEPQERTPKSVCDPKRPDRALYIPPGQRYSRRSSQHGEGLGQSRGQSSQHGEGLGQSRGQSSQHGEGLGQSRGQSSQHGEGLGQSRGQSSQHGEGLGQSRGQSSQHGEGLGQSRGQSSQHGEGLGQSRGQSSQHGEGLGQSRGQSSQHGEGLGQSRGQSSQSFVYSVEVKRGIFAEREIDELSDFQAVAEEITTYYNLRKSVKMAIEMDLREKANHFFN